MEIKYGRGYSPIAEAFIGTCMRKGELSFVTSGTGRPCPSRPSLVRSSDMWTYKYVILVHEQTATQRYTSIEKAAFAASIFLMSMAAQGKTPKVWVCKAEIGNVNAVSSD